MMSDYPFVRIAEKYPDIEPWHVEFLYYLSCRDESVTDMACSILSHGSFGNRWLESLKGQSDLIHFARTVVNCKVSSNEINSIGILLKND